MQLSLSGRIAEAEHSKEHAALDFASVAQLAASIGFEAVCVRPSQLTIDDPVEHAREMRATLNQHGLVASMITPDARVARQGSDPDANALLHQIGPALRLASVLGAGLVRVAIKGEEDIPRAQRAADEAREHGIRLVHQNHTATPFETVAGCREMVGRIDRSNFGLSIEPANFVLCGEDYGLSALKPLGPHIFNVYVQNLRITPDGTSEIDTRQGIVRYERLVVGDPAGIDLPQFFDGLAAVGYNGFVTTHQPAIEGLTERELAQRVYDGLAPFVRS
ncbi:MAG: xylose isomerase [Dehalococcoidia bacterium]|nr:xylose isomerase [Dehalococcoidia bacterium]